MATVHYRYADINGRRSMAAKRTVEYALNQRPSLRLRLDSC
jgi:hypothetical protein